MFNNLFFQLFKSSKYDLLSLQNSFTVYLQKVLLIGPKSSSQKVVILVVVIFPADCTSLTGISKMHVWFILEFSSLWVLNRG